MTTMIGTWFPKSISSNSLVSDRTTWRELSLLVGLGAAAVLIHAATRGGLDLAPGYQGVTWIAFLFMGRTTSRYRWAAVASAAGAAGTAMLPVWGFGDPFRWLTYFLAGAVVDVLYLLAARQTLPWWLIGVLGGLAHMTKPLTRVLINALTGWPYGSLLWGVVYPTTTHFVFGFLGALAGAGLLVAFHRLSQAKHA